MRAAVCWMLIAGVLLACEPAGAQIYTCIDEKGTRVYSSTRCGPDATVVEGVGTKKRAPAKGAATAKPVRKARSASELEDLIKLCDAGDIKSCNEWTLGGGPNLLREKERKSEQECEAGSLSACEERYCRDGFDQDCRARVLRTARLAGDTWYLRAESYRQQEGLRLYDIRCLPQGPRTPRDITVACATQAGPNRCYLSKPGQGFDRLSNAAAKYCEQAGSDTARAAGSDQPAAAGAN